jgi:alpha,alpha-trehalase
MFGLSDRRLAPALAVLAVLAACAGPPAEEPRTAAVLPRVSEVATPLELYGELFRDVQMQRVFCDSKTFVDAVPKDETPAAITER